MAKAANSAVGVDLGNHTLKAVRLLRRSGGRVALAGYTVRECGDRGMPDDEMQHHLKLLVEETGGKVKAHGASLFTQDTVLRVVDQPATPVEVMRNALKFNATQILHEEVKDHMLDCDTVNGQNIEPTGGGSVAQVKYVVGGIPRAAVESLTASFDRSRLGLDALQLGPISLLNAFEYGRPEVFRNEPFLLLDIGHERSTVVGGSQGRIVMIRTIDFGGKSLLEDVMMNGAIDREAAILLLEQGDGGLTELAEKSLQLISREMLSSIGFYEAQLDRTIDKIYVSGASTRAMMVLQALSDNLNFPCEAWDPFGNCEVALAPDRRRALERDGRCLNVAFGVALSLIRGDL